MLLMIVMGMSGIYRGMIEDATMLTRQIGADLWLVEHASRGPFAEESHVSTSLVYRALAVPGVQSAREFVQHTVVGISHGMIDLGGDGISMFTAADALTIQSETPNEAIRLERATRYVRGEKATWARSSRPSWTLITARRCFQAASNSVWRSLARWPIGPV